MRLTFGAINDNPDIFPNDEYFGLGLFRHQDFANNKTTSTWDHPGTCYDFTDLDTEMFRSTNVKTAGHLFIPALVLSAVSLFTVLAIKYKSVQSKKMMAFTILATVVSAILQVVVFGVMFHASGNDVCSIDRYAANIDDQWAWYIDYPSPLFPYVAYMRFMQGCDLGSTAKIAIAAIFFQFLVSVLALANWVFATDEDTSEVSSVPIVSEIPPVKPVRTRKIFDEEAQDQTIEGSYENNPLGPLALSAPEPILDDKFNDDNISYDIDLEDEIKAEDDLSLAGREEPVPTVVEAVLFVEPEVEVEDATNTVEAEDFIDDAVPAVEDTTGNVEAEEFTGDAVPEVEDGTGIVEAEEFTDDAVPEVVDATEVPAPSPEHLTIAENVEVELEEFAEDDIPEEAARPTASVTPVKVHGSGTF